MDKCKYITISGNILSDKRLNSTDKLVCGIIESACRMGSGNCTLNNKSISDILGVSKSYVKRAIAKLERFNIVTKKQSYEAHGKKGTWRTIEITSLGGELQECPHGESLLCTEGSHNSVPQKNINKNNNKYIVEIKEIIDYLNFKARKNFRSSTAATQSLIKARLNEGFTVEDFKKVIDIKCNEWLGSDYAQYLRPQTLFGTKFESYLNTIDTVKTKKDFDILSTYETL